MCTKCAFKGLLKRCSTEERTTKSVHIFSVSYRTWENMNIPVPPPPPPPPPLLPIDQFLHGRIPGESNGEGDSSKSCFNKKPITLDEFRQTLINHCNVHDHGGGFTIKTSLVLDNYLQKGPVCGIVALSTAVQIAGKSVNPDDLLEKARENKYTVSGEMFSVTNMYNLAKEFVQCHILDCSSEKLFDAVNGGDVVLVAYDADRNHYPGLKNGRKAHWALIYGVATKNTETLGNTFTEEKLEKTGELYVVGGQGKSAKPSLWKLSDLVESNWNLVESHVKDDIDLRQMFIVISKNC